jgi:hypothetical protein
VVTDAPNNFLLYQKLNPETGVPVKEVQRELQGAPAFSKAVDPLEMPRPSLKERPVIRASPKTKPRNKIGKPRKQNRKPNNNGL